MRYFITCLFLFTCFALSGAADSAQAATCQVGPTRTLKKLQDVAPLHTLLAPGTAAARPSDGLIDIGAYEYTP